MVTQREDDGRTVVDDFRAGDEPALAEIYGRWSPLIYSFALRSLGGRVAEAEGVTQRVFATAWTTRASFDPQRGPLSAWLIAITREKIAKVLVGGEAVAAPAQLAERLLLADGVSQLEAEPQQVVRMALYGALTHGQIAERTGLSTPAVKGHLRRGLGRLREQLEVQPHAC